MLVASQGPPARLWETEFCGQRLAAASSRERRTDPPNCRRRPRSTLLTLIRSRDFGALGTTAADQDFLVELRGFEPLTSAMRSRRRPAVAAPGRCSRQPRARSAFRDPCRHLGLRRIAGRSWKFFVLRATDRPDIPLGFAQWAATLRRTSGSAVRLCTAASLPSI